MACLVQDACREDCLGIGNGQRNQYGEHQRRITCGPRTIDHPSILERSGGDVRRWGLRDRRSEFPGKCPHLRLRRRLIVRSLFVLQPRDQSHRRRSQARPNVDTRNPTTIAKVSRSIVDRFRFMIGRFRVFHLESVLLCSAQSHTVTCSLVLLYRYEQDMRMIQQRISNKKLNKLLVDFESGPQVD